MPPRRDSSPPRLDETLRAEHAAGNAGATHRAIGQRVGVPHQHVGEWRDPLSGRVLKLTKVVKLGPTLAPRFLRALAAKLEESAPHARRDIRDAVLEVQEAAGAIARCAREILADNHITDDEDLLLEAALLAAEAKLTAVRAARAEHRASRSVR